jgi:hypothetical protein
MHHAVALYFGGDESKADSLGHVASWTKEKRLEVSRLITVAATGGRSRGQSSADPCFTIVDAGEGQTPSMLPETILSLDRRNKVKIKFVQGKFNMGGTGVLQFCGRHNMQLVLSRRDPAILSDDSTDTSWGFTVVRREDPPPGEKSSIYTYLAPRHVGSDEMGGVLMFAAPGLPVVPDGRRPYAKTLQHGTLVKLYEYHAKGFRSMMFMRDGLLSRLDILLPGIGLPIRLHECRDFSGQPDRSFETTASGLTSRLGDNRGDNLESEPRTSRMTVRGESMTLKIYVFKKDRASTYRKNEGIVFTINGQTHGYLTTDFFRRKAVGMGRLADSLLVEVDCTQLTSRSREDLFMNSRDRLRGGELKSAIVEELEGVLRSHPWLRALREERRRQEIADRLSDARPLEDALVSILKSSPALSSLFTDGTRIPNPFKIKEVAEREAVYEGKRHPTFFNFLHRPMGDIIDREVAINFRARVTFETDVENDYFGRPDNPGQFQLMCRQETGTKRVRDHSLNLNDGKATLNVTLPDTVQVGDRLEYTATVADDTLVFPFTNVFRLRVAGPQQASGGKSKPTNPPSEEEGNKRQSPDSLAIPEIREVSREGWMNRNHPFDESSALEVVQEEAATPVDEGGRKERYSFWVNVDNQYLAAEMKRSDIDAPLVKARFVYGMVLIGMALIRASEDAPSSDDHHAAGEPDDGVSIEDQVFAYTRSVAPVLLPLIETLGSLDEDSFSEAAGVGEEI